MITTLWGLGSKVALAYIHTFFIDTIYNGILYHYMFSKQANGIPAGELIYSEETDECNGTTIKIPIKTGDLSTFRGAIERQLIYFPNIYVESGKWYNNDFKIYEFDSFVYRPDLLLKDMHIVIGNVYYPIAWNELEISPIEFPVALKFKIGDLMPTPSREDILYSKESIDAIKSKISDVFYFLQGKINERVKEVDTIAEYEPYYGKKHFEIEISDDVKLPIKKELLNDKRYFQYNGDVVIKGTNKYIDSDILYGLRYFGYKIYEKYLYSDYHDYGLKRTFSDSDMSNYSHGIDFNKISRYTFNNKYPKYPGRLSFSYVYTPPSKSQSEYSHKIMILDEDEALSNNELNITITRNNPIYFFKKIKLNLDFHKVYLNELDIPKKHWRECINLVSSKAEEYVTSTFKKYSDCIVDEDFVAEYRDNLKLRAAQNIEKADRAKELIKISIFKRDYSYGYLWYDDYMHPSQIKKLYKNIIWFEHNDRAAAKTIHTILQNIYDEKPIFGVISISRSHVKKHFSDCKNIISYSDFIESNLNITKKIATAYVIKKELTTTFVSMYHIQKLNSRFLHLNEYLQEFVCKYLPNSNSYENLSIFKKIFDNMKKIGNIDKNIIADAMEFKCLKYKFDLVDGNFKQGGVSQLCISDSMKTHNFPIDRKYYLNPEFNELYNK